VYLFVVPFLILDPFISCLDLQIGLNWLGLRREPFQHRKTGRIAIELLLQHGVRRGASHRYELISCPIHVVVSFLHETRLGQLVASVSLR
jgi:hypothetical protein